MPDQTQPAATKICIRCGQDCAGRPRSRDSKGRYTCQACIDAAMARQRDDEFRRERAAMPPLPAHLTDPGPDAGKPLDLAPDPVHDAGPCPKCKAPIAEGAIICTSCGYNRAAGGRIKTLTGDAAVPKDKLQIERELAARAYRLEYIRPIAMFVIGFTVLAVLLASNGQTNQIPFRLVVFGLNVIIGLGVFWLCSLVYIDFDGPLGLTALRLLGIYGVVEAVSIAMIMFVPNPWVMWMVPTVLYLGLLSTMMDINVGDAIVVAMVTGILRPAVFLLLMSL